MQAITTKPAQRESGEQVRARAIVRFNGLMFHSLATASFLETAVPAQVHRAGLALAGCPDAAQWLEQVWWPRRSGIGRRLREYVQTTWPEFDWNAAYQEFYEARRAAGRPGGGRRGPALAALELCATASQAAVFYRALARCADEPALRALAREAADEHAAYFDHFRGWFERSRRHGRVGLVAGLRTVLATCREAREHDVRAAFEPLARHWTGPGTVAELGYEEYRARMASFIQRHVALGCLERLLFRPWLEPARAPGAQPAIPAQPRRWLPPALETAAA